VKASRLRPVLPIMFRIKHRDPSGAILAAGRVSLIWVPYAFILIMGFASRYPIMDPQDEPLPAVGFVLLFVAFLYCLYIAFINFLAFPEQ